MDEWIVVYQCNAERLSSKKNELTHPIAWLSLQNTMQREEGKTQTSTQCKMTFRWNSGKSKSNSHWQKTGPMIFFWWQASSSLDWWGDYMSNHIRQNPKCILTTGAYHLWFWWSCPPEMAVCLCQRAGVSSTCVLRKLTQLL